MKHTIAQLFRKYHKLSHVFWASFPMLAPSGCRFEPTCSEYSALAVERHGVFYGLYKSVLRVIRCNPLTESRVDLP
ncbi:MAG: membrane protein insertion efficiency factor YidD [Patescibacteria group bacterium]